LLKIERVYTVSSIAEQTHQSNVRLHRIFAAGGPSPYSSCSSMASMNSWGAVLGRALHVALVPGRELGIQVCERIIDSSADRGWGVAGRDECLHNFILVIERRLKLFVPHMYGSLILDHRRL
jgi:hypothetical protein